jgi:DnaJ domain
MKASETIAAAAAALLGVDPGATAQEVNHAAKRFARMWHPDVRRNDPDAHRRMTEANDARRVLLAAAKSGASRTADESPSRSKKNRGRRARTRTHSDPATSPHSTMPRNRVVWPAPPTAASRFFTERGLVLRPTDARISFRVFAAGAHQYTLVRHPENPDVLYCRDATGLVTQVGGVGFWFDDGVEVEPLLTEPESGRA